MRGWKWAAGLMVAAALATFATLWALTAADVLRWGATAVLHDRIENLQASIVALEVREAQFIVVHREVLDHDDHTHPCVVYTAPGDSPTRTLCREVRDGDADDCADMARIGEALPACWR